MSINHVVKEGDCISSIAYENGFFPDTIWNHPNNAELKKKRGNMNILMPGDIVFVPDKRLKEVRESTDQVHKYVVKTTPASLNLRVLDDGRPLGNRPFILDIDGRITKGMTDSDGCIRATAVPNAEMARLSVGRDDEEKREYRLVLRAVTPLDKISGVKIRLHNLGYDVGTIDEEMTDQLERSIKAFETDYDLEETGQINDRNRAKLKEIYGC